jgi:X-X-X-Leu-X-X-Gly heptad repeat protein
MRSATLPAYILIGLSLATGCSKHDSSATGQDSSSSKTGAAATSTASNDTIVRGTLKDVSDSIVTLTTSSGDVRVALATPVKVFTRATADLSRVSDHAFIGVTSVPQPGGTQRATEIHIFPEELRGLGEGSRPMTAPSGGSGGTMTNGSVSDSRMTNGSATMTNGSATMTNGSATMTNGAARMKDSASGGGRTMTVAYQGGSQTITVPPNVSVTEIVATSTKLAPGASVVIPATKRPDGTLTTSRIMLANARAQK